jgi:hypothetical protein
MRVRDIVAKYHPIFSNDVLHLVCFRPKHLKHSIICKQTDCYIQKKIEQKQLNKAYSNMAGQNWAIIDAAV